MKEYQIFRSELGKGVLKDLVEQFYSRPLGSDNAIEMAQRVGARDVVQYIIDAIEDNTDDISTEV